MNRLLRLSALLLLCFFSISSFAQSQQLLLPKKSSSPKSRRTVDRGDCPKAYIGFNLGFNNQNGLIGISLDVPIIKQMSLGAGIGRSSWGWKYFGEARFYFSECHRGFAIGAGVSHNTGLKDFETTLPTNYSDEDQVLMDCDPQTNGFVALYHMWTIGRHHNRFSLHAGWSVPLSEPAYTIKSGQTLTDDGTKTMDILTPGGLVIGVGFYFNLSSPN